MVTITDEINVVNQKMDEDEGENRSETIREKSGKNYSFMTTAIFIISDYLKTHFDL